MFSEPFQTQHTEIDLILKCPPNILHLNALYHVTGKYIITCPIGPSDISIYFQTLKL